MAQNYMVRGNTKEGGKEGSEGDRPISRIFS